MNERICDICKKGGQVGDGMNDDGDCVGSTVRDQQIHTSIALLPLYVHIYCLITCNEVMMYI